MTHETKIEKKFYDLKLKKRKMFEVRKNDRNYEEGDTVIYTPIEVRNKEAIVLEHLPKIKTQLQFVLKGYFAVQKGYVVYGETGLKVFHNGEWISPNQMEGL